MERYDPKVAPDSKEWLALDEGERTLLVEQYHRDARIELPKRARSVHAMIHTVVENQLALDNQMIVRGTLVRLMRDGLARHQAVHAIGSVLIEYVHDLLHAKIPSTDDHASYYAALQQLSPDVCILYVWSLIVSSVPCDTSRDCDRPIWHTL